MHENHYHYNLKKGLIIEIRTYHVTIYSQEANYVFRPVGLQGLLRADHARQQILQKIFVGLGPKSWQQSIFLTIKNGHMISDKENREARANRIRESMEAYSALFDNEKCDIAAGNTLTSREYA